MKKKNEFNYFDEFAKSAGLAMDAIKEFKNYVYNFNNEISENEMKKIHEIENKADDNLHEIKKHLLRDFLPPIDREDIVAISHKIDDLVDSIDETAIDMNIYNIESITEDMKNSVTLLEKIIENVYNLVIAMKNLKNAKDIKENVIEVNKLEEQADRLYEEAIRKLYQNENNAIQIIKWSKIYESIENCFDACENIADCIEEVLLKNG